MPIKPDIPLFKPWKKQQGSQTLEDDYDFASVAKHVADSILQIESPEGFVVGIEGEWGSGKTTFSNFILAELLAPRTAGKPQAADLLVRYNAWLAVDETDAAMGLLAEIRNVLEVALQQSGKESRKGLIQSALGSLSTLADAYRLGEYGAATKAGQSVLRRLSGRGSIDQHKGAIDEALQALGCRLYIFIDDLDRMAAQHLRVLFATIKTVCDIPKLFFLLALDKQVVADALTQVQGGDGMAYLDKIISLAVPVPFIERENLLRRLLQQWVAEFALDPKILMTEKWRVIEANGISRFLRKPRDVIRFANATALTYPQVAADVSFEDFVALEALRLFEPRVHTRIKEISSDLLAATGEESKENIRALLALEPRTGQAQRARTLAQLFPLADIEKNSAGYQDISTTAVANPDKFGIYFQFGLVPGALSEKEYATAIATARASCDAFATYLQTAIVQPVRGGLSLVQRIFERALEKWPANLSAEQLANMIMGLSMLHDQAITSANQPSLSGAFPTLLLTAKRFAEYTARRYNIEMLTACLARTCKTQSLQVLGAVIHGFESAADEFHQEALRETALGAIGQIKAEHVALCIRQMTRGTLWENPSLADVLRNCGRFDSAGALRKHVGDHPLGADAAMQIVSQFFAADWSPEKGEARNDRAHAGEVIRRLTEVFPIEQFDVVLGHAKPTAEAWMNSFESLRAEQKEFDAYRKKKTPRIKFKSAAEDL